MTKGGGGLADAKITKKCLKIARKYGFLSFSSGHINNICQIMYFLPQKTGYSGRGWSVAKGVAKKTGWPKNRLFRKRVDLFIPTGARTRQGKKTRTYRDTLSITVTHFKSPVPYLTRLLNGV